MILTKSSFAASNAWEPEHSAVKLHLRLFTLIHPEVTMSQTISRDVIASFQHYLDQHPVYAAVETLADLRCFMQHHVYSVWDFMSLIKYLQSVIAPSHVPWVPRGNPNVRRFINELVLEEESDQTQVEGEFSSHFELYQMAMKEIGAHTETSTRFVAQVQTNGIESALNETVIPAPARQFTNTTFSFILANKPHQVAAALALGREHIIPNMFRSILAKIGVTAEQAPVFHFYLNRHIHLDEDFHAPLSLLLLNELCEGNAQKIDEAIAAANSAVRARLAFWDGVLTAIEANKQQVK